MRTYRIEYISEIFKDSKSTEKREVLVKALNISLALEKMACKVNLYRRILSIREILTPTTQIKKS